MLYVRRRQWPAQVRPDGVFTHRVFSNRGCNERSFHRGRLERTPDPVARNLPRFQLQSAPIEIWNTAGTLGDRR